MAGILRDIKVITKDLSDRIQVLNAYIFGNKDIYEYNENKLYNAGDFIKRLNPNTNEYEILQCVKNGVKGPFNPEDWKHNVVSDFTSGQKVNRNIIQVSEIEPIDPANIIWWEIKAIKGYTDVNAGGDNFVLISTDSQIISQDEKPTHEDVKIWFDHEPFDD